MIGSAAVLAFAWINGAGRIQPGDIILLLSVAASALGYAEGARVAREIPGWQVMSWALVFGAPLHIIPLVLVIRAYGLSGAPPIAWAAFAYVAVISQWLGMFAWLKGLAAGGIARVGQLQLLQPFCTFVFAAALLAEKITAAMVVAAVVVFAAVAAARNAPVELRPGYADNTRSELASNDTD
jgi:drug/metabolite transporter (DMT)-like permease